MGQIGGAGDLSHVQPQPAATFQPDKRKPESPRIPGHAAAAAIFAVSRLIVFLAILFSVRFIPPNNLPIAWNDGATIWHYLLRWDSVWYLSIMRVGYPYLPNSSVPSTVVFFSAVSGLVVVRREDLSVPVVHRSVARVQRGEYRSRSAPLSVCSRALRRAGRIWRRGTVQFLSCLDISLRQIYGISRNGAEDGDISRSGPRPIHQSVVLVWVTDRGTTDCDRDACAAGLLPVAACRLDPRGLDAVATRPWHRMFGAWRIRRVPGIEIQRLACLRNRAERLETRSVFFANRRTSYVRELGK